MSTIRRKHPHIEDGTLVWVAFVDSLGQGEWMLRRAIEEFAADPAAYCEAVGWVVHEDDESLVIAATRNVQSICNFIRIPKVAIYKRRKVPLT